MPSLTAAMEVARSGQTSGPLRSPETWLPGEWKKKVECGPALESEVKSELPHLPKVLEEPKVKRDWRMQTIRMKKCRPKSGGGLSKVAKQWHCHVCGKHVSSSNRAKHMNRIHPGFYTGRRGRPRVLRECVDLD